MEHQYIETDTLAQAEDFDISRQMLNDSEKYPWFSKAYNEYTPDAAMVGQLKRYRKGLSFIVYAGSWCEDTHIWLPKFYKAMEQAGVKASNIKLIGVDRDKKPVIDPQTKTGLNNNGNVDRVPAFYIFYKGQPAGEIIESPSNSIEADVLEKLKTLSAKKAEHKAKSKKS